MRQYLQLVRHVLANGKLKKGPQDMPALTVVGYEMRFNPRLGFPLITTRAIHPKSWRALVGELLWFISGSGNVKDLNRFGIHLWDPWASAPAAQELAKRYQREPEDLGPIYGPLWRRWPTTDGKTIDQLATVIEGLKSNPYSRRHAVTAWNPEFLDQVFVAPCHCLYHFTVVDNTLSLTLFQRSADVMVGVPFNIASYTLLLTMVAQVTGYKVGEFVHFLSDTHIYENHVATAQEQTRRDPRPLPRLRLSPSVTDIDRFTSDDVVLEGYNPHPPLTYEPAL